MGWNIETRKGKQETEYRIWSTVSDSWLNEWSTRDEVLVYIFFNKFNRLIEDFVKESMFFPGEYVNKKMVLYRAEEKMYDEYHKLLRQSYRVKEDDIDPMDEKFKEILSRLEINVGIEYKGEKKL